MDYAQVQEILAIFFDVLNNISIFFSNFRWFDKWEFWKTSLNRGFRQSYLVLIWNRTKCEDCEARFTS